MHVHVQIASIDVENDEFLEGTVVASVDCSSWSADRVKALWEFLHTDSVDSSVTVSRPQVHSPTVASAPQGAPVAAVEACGPCGRVSSGVDHVEA